MKNAQPPAISRTPAWPAFASMAGNRGHKNVTLNSASLTGGNPLAASVGVRSRQARAGGRRC